MKRTFLLVITFCALQLCAQVSWQKMANFPGTGRDHAIAFSNGTKGYVMTGEDGNTGAQDKDFWEYDSGNNTWTKLADYPGAARSYGIGGVINGKAYIGMGHSGSTFLTDWWQYDFTTSTWTKKNNFPGTGRDHPTASVMNGKLYMGFGDNKSGSMKDWWMYDPSNDSWVQKTTYPGYLMHHPVSAANNNIIYVTEGHIVDGSQNHGSVYSYAYNTTNDTWSQLANMPGPGVVAGASFCIGNGIIYSGCGIEEPTPTYHDEFYAYNISSNTWSSITNYPGTGIFGPVTFVIGSAGYVVTGMDVTNGSDTQDNYRLALMVALDAGVSTISSPSGTICSSSFTPSVAIQNFGTSTLTSCTINYQVDNTAPQTFNWSGSLATNATANVTLPSITVSAGTHTFTASTSNPNGNSDGNPGNDQMQVIFTAASSGASLPLQESFESSATIPSGWNIVDMSSDGFKWTLNTSVSGFGTGSHCMSFDNCNPSTDITGRKDRFVTVPYNFSNATTAQMTFDVAYTYLVLNSTTYTDTLAVYYSADCGTTWNQIYVKGGAALSTAPNLTTASPTCFTPSSSQWRTETVNLNTIAGQSSVMFAFENRSDWAEILYVDNINITAVTSVAENNFSEEINIYPNPVSDEFTLEGKISAGKIHYEILNIVGEKIKSGEIYSNGTNFRSTIGVEELPGGMYFIKLNDGINSATKKINKQ